MTVHKLVHVFAQNVKFEFSRIEKSQTMILHTERLVNRIVMAIKRRRRRRKEEKRRRRGYGKIC